MGTLDCMSIIWMCVYVLSFSCAELVLFALKDSVIEDMKETFILDRLICRINHINEDVSGLI